MTETQILILNLWESMRLLHSAINDEQPSRRKEIGLNTLKYLSDDMRLIFHAYGVKPE